MALVRFRCLSLVVSRLLPFEFLRPRACLIAGFAGPRRPLPSLSEVHFFATASTHSRKPSLEIRTRGETGTAPHASMGPLHAEPVSRKSK